MQEVADWLNGLGMSEHAPRFAENDIDMEVLGELTDADFESPWCFTRASPETFESPRLHSNSQQVRY